MSGARIAVGPVAPGWVKEAIVVGGGTTVGLEAPADGLVWLDSTDPGGLRDALATTGQPRWVQLPSAGIEGVARSGLFGGSRWWTCAKGAYGEAVAEHALALALAGLRRLPERAQAQTWGPSGGRSLYDGRVTIVGGGGICAALLDLLAPFRARATVVKRTAAPMPGAERTLTVDRLQEALAGALVVFLALPLTSETTGLVGEAELAAMDEDAWLVNVARGAVIDTEALVRALDKGVIAGAALDVTDPEPLPDGHPLWDSPRCLVTPHTANTAEMVRPQLTRRITENVRRFIEGAPLLGVVDTDAGY